jgi:TonB family protein
MNAQELIIGHLLPIAVTIAVLWLVYRLLFRDSNRLYFNRFFLLTSLLIALAMPLLGLLSGMESQQMVVLKQNLFGGGIMLNEVIVTPDGQPVLPEVSVTTSTTPSRFSVWQVLGGLYLIGVGVMTLLFLFKLGKLAALIIRSPKRKMSGCTAVFTGRDQGSFSFFRYAFFPNENVDPDIMRHEMSHISHHHSWDILFAEVMMILQWFNPFIYLYKKELQSLHEYQADRDVVATGVDKKNYMMLILQQCTAVDFSKMSNNFSLILTKKRIKMITKNEKAKGLWWRLLATLPVLAILLVANTKVTAQDASNRLSNQADDKPITVEMGKFEIRDDNGNTIQLMDTVVYNEDGSYVQCVATDGVDPETGESCKKFKITTHNADGTPNGSIMNLRWEMDGDVVQYTAEPFSITEESLETLLGGLSTLADAPEKDSIFQVVDEMPEFPGGPEAMMKFVTSNVKYPEKAKDEGIAGRVFVSFVVEKDGTVSNVKVLRGIGGGCDEEAVRVVKSMPKWKPGMQKGKPVRVNFNMPFTFKLDGPSTNGLENTTWEGSGTGTQDGASYIMKMDMEFESETTGYFVMTLTVNKEGHNATVFEDVGLPFNYTFDGKKIGVIQPKNPDGSDLGETPAPPYGFLKNSDGTITVSFYDFKEDIGVEKIVFKKVDK